MTGKRCGVEEGGSNEGCRKQWLRYHFPGMSWHSFVDRSATGAEDVDEPMMCQARNGAGLVEGGESIQALTREEHLFKGQRGA